MKKPTLIHLLLVPVLALGIQSCGSKKQPVRPVGKPVEQTTDGEFEIIVEGEIPGEPRDGDSTRPPRDEGSRPGRRGDYGDIHPPTEGVGHIEPGEETLRRDWPRRESDPWDERELAHAAKYRTGGVLGPDLFYVGSGADELVPYFRGRMEAVSEGFIRERNQTLADSIDEASVEFRGQRTEITIRFVTARVDDARNPARSEIVILSGELDERGYALVEATGRGTFSQKVTGELRCLDQGGGCQTSFLRLAVGESGSRAIGNIVFRKTRGGLHAQFPKPQNESRSPYYTSIRDYILRAQGRNSGRDVFDKVFYDSFTVILGKSAFHIALEALDGELVEFYGDCVAPRGEQLQVAVELTQKRVGNYRYELASGIEHVDLVKNSGQGPLRLRVLAKGDRQDRDQSFDLNISRNLAPIIPVNTESLYF